MGDDDRIRPARKSSVTPAGVWTTYGAQNLPAVLNDPQKGKQRDFFTRSWGVEFTETSPLPLVQPSAGVTDSINRTHFERYLKRVRKYGSSSRRDPLLKSSGTSSRASPIEDAASPVHARAVRINDTSHIPAPFLDQNLSLSKRDTFERIFPFIKEGSRPGSPTFNERMMMSGRLIQEKLTHHLDHVEVDIAKQVSQKSHHFFQVMTYHDALINQLSILITLIHHLRSKLQGVNSSAFKMFLKVCQLRRRQQNARCVQEKLGLMSSIHQTQPTIQVLLASSEFSGALDLITTSRDILAVDLKNIVSFRHLSPQLQEIHSVIGRMLLADFKTYISMQIGQDNVHIKASELTSTSYYQDIDSDQLHCVIQGLIRQRQDSYEFLEKFEEASIMSVKRVIKEVSLSQFSETDSTVVAEFAKRANSQEWITFMDVLIGTLVLLLKRIQSLYLVITDTIIKVNETSDAITISDNQVQALKESNDEVMVNICDQVHERCAKILSQRSKPGSEELVNVIEICAIQNLVQTLSQETLKITNKSSPSLHLSLQSQTLLMIQSFHERQKQKLLKLLEREKWRKTEIDGNGLKGVLVNVALFRDLFDCSDPVHNSDMRSQNGNDSAISSSESLNCSEQQDNKGERSEEETTERNLTERKEPNNEQQSSLIDQQSNTSGSTITLHSEDNGTKKNPYELTSIGVITLANGDSYCMTDSIPDFLIILSEYCNLCDKLTSTGHELGVKAAELITFFNSRVCQLVLGAGAITTSGLKTITIRNLALVLRNLQLVENFIPRIFDHFSARMAPPGETSAKPAVDSLRRQFDHSRSNVSNHVEMIQQKITDVVEAILKQHLSTWQPHNQVPSTNFKALCKQLTKLHESVSDIWPEEKIRILFDKVHGLFLSLVQSEIHLRGLNTSSASRPTSKAASKQLQDRETTKRALLSELVFYGQSMIRLDIIDAEKLQREEFEQLWT